MFLCQHCEYDNDCDRILDVNTAEWKKMALFDITVIKNDTWFRTEIHNVCSIYTCIWQYLVSVQEKLTLKY